MEVHIRRSEWNLNRLTALVLLHIKGYCVLILALIISGSLKLILIITNHDQSA